jgi:hypothetical protein
MFFISIGTNDIWKCSTISLLRLCLRNEDHYFLTLWFKFIFQLQHYCFANTGIENLPKSLVIKNTLIVVALVFSSFL